MKVYLVYSIAKKCCDIDADVGNLRECFNVIYCWLSNTQNTAFFLLRMA